MVKKMAEIFQTTLSKAVSWKKKFYILIQISIKFVPKSPVDN